MTFNLHCQQLAEMWRGREHWIAVSHDQNFLLASPFQCMTLGKTFKVVLLTNAGMNKTTVFQSFQGNFTGGAWMKSSKTF